MTPGFCLFLKSGQAYGELYLAGVLGSVQGGHHTRYRLNKGVLDEALEPDAIAVDREADFFLQWPA